VKSTSFRISRYKINSFRKSRGYLQPQLLEILLGILGMIRGAERRKLEGLSKYLGETEINQNVL